MRPAPIARAYTAEYAIWYNKYYVVAIYLETKISLKLF